MQQDVILLKFKLSPWFDLYSLSSFGELPGGLAWLGTDISGPTLKMRRTVGPEMSVPNHIKTPGNSPKENKL
jgi:hypothetical protein